MNILFRGLGPKESVTYQGRILHNGASIHMDDAHAGAYVQAGLAVPVENENQVVIAQELERKNALTRKRIQEKAEKQAEIQEGGDV